MRIYRFYLSGSSSNSINDAVGKNEESRKFAYGLVAHLSEDHDVSSKGGITPSSALLTWQTWAPPVPQVGDDHGGPASHFSFAAL